MIEVETALFTVAVFQDVAWAQKGLDALKQAGFAPESLTVLAKDSPEVSSLIQRTFGAAGQRFELATIGPVVAHGPLIEALLLTSPAVPPRGLAGTMRRVGFQSHDCRIFEVLTGRGGVLVALHNAPRAADGLAIFHSYGGGNAAIGAWSGRV